MIKIHFYTCDASMGMRKEVCYLLMQTSSPVSLSKPWLFLLNWFFNKYFGILLQKSLPSQYITSFTCLELGYTSPSSPSCGIMSREIAIWLMCVSRFSIVKSQFFASVDHFCCLYALFFHFPRIHLEVFTLNYPYWYGLY